MELDPQKILADSDFQLAQEAGVTLGKIREELAEVVENPLFQLLMSAMITVDAVFITLQACIGYEVFGEPSDLQPITHFLQGASRFILSFLVVDVICLFVAHGVELIKKPSYILYCGVIVGLVYFEFTQCWLGGACDWIGMLLFLRIPYALYNAGIYVEYLQDFNRRPAFWIRKCQFYLDHPLVHVYVTGLTLMVGAMFAAWVALELVQLPGWINQAAAESSLHVVRTNIYYLFLMDTLLHCYFIGLEGLCHNYKAGLDAAIVLFCWTLQVILDPKYSVYTSIVMIGRLHRLGRVAYNDWATGRGDHLYHVTLNEAVEMVDEQVGRAVTNVEGALDVSVPGVIQSGAESSTGGLASALGALKFHVVSVLLVIVEIAVFAVLITMSYRDAIKDMDAK